eukprot:scaffold121216_cov63-Phaeocystis_antarctica.AAC.1
MHMNSTGPVSHKGPCNVMVCRLARAHPSRVHPWQRVDLPDELVLARRGDAAQHGRREVGVGPELMDDLVKGAAAAQQLAHLVVGAVEHEVLLGALGARRLRVAALPLRLDATALRLDA